MVLDAFVGERLPAHLLTREAFREIRDRLAPRGILCVHLLAAPEDPLVASVLRTLEAVFPEVKALGTDGPARFQDLFLFASRGPLAVPGAAYFAGRGIAEPVAFDPPRANALLLTDDADAVARLGAEAARTLRRLQR